MKGFNGKPEDELPEREVFSTLLEVRVLTEQYRQTYNRVRPHNSLASRQPAPEAMLPAEPIPELVGPT
jgi:transposase InsO family protein